MPLDGLHLDRVRAESFGSIAEQYDRYRPTYPDALIDDLAALEPTDFSTSGVAPAKPPSRWPIEI